MKNIKNRLLTALLILTTSINATFAMDEAATAFDKSSPIRYFSKETFTDQSLEGFQVLCEPFPSLHEIHLTNLKFCKKEEFVNKWIVLCENLPNNPNLKNIILKNCIIGRLPAKCWQIFEKNLQQCLKLSSLDLSYNRSNGLQKNLLLHLLESLKEIKLRHINLSHKTLKHYQCDRSGHENCRFKEILITLSQYPSLKELDLSYNNLDHTHISLLFTLLPHFEALETLNLTANTYCMNKLAIEKLVKPTKLPLTIICE